MKKNISYGFTLIEVLLVIAILAILAAIVIVAVNPAKQFGDSQNAQRWSDVRAILNAVHQYSIDNYGSYPNDIPVGIDCLTGGFNVCQAGMSCDGVTIDDVIVDEKYLTDIPSDPTTATDQITGYLIMQNGNGRVSVCAPSAYGDAVISVTQ